MEPVIHLIIEGGPGKGRSLSIPPAGARVGRSSKNDIVIDDPLMSRHHCRFFFLAGDGLHVADLGSANHTVVNDRPCTSTRLHKGDRIVVGTSLFRVVDDAAPEGTPADAPPSVDLGLGTPPDEQAPQRRGLNRSLLLGGVALVSIIALAIWIPRLLPDSTPPGLPLPDTAAPPAQDSQPMEVEYEKIEADGARIFRYAFSLNADRTLTVRIDDTSNTHMKEQRSLEPETIRELADFIRSTDFFTLSPEFVGLQPKVLESYVIRVTFGARTHQVRVENYNEPLPFKTVRERLEHFGHVELGLWAMQYPPDKLEQMARDAFQQGRKLFEEREINIGNLAAAIRSHAEAEFYLRTVEPKPDFYAEMLKQAEDCRSALTEKYNNLNFSAERAIRLRSWDEAATLLRTICELIPDRSDQRSADARKQLLEVERRISSEKLER